MANHSPKGLLARLGPALGRSWGSGTRISRVFLHNRRFTSFPFPQVRAQGGREAGFTWISLDLFTHRALNLQVLKRCASSMPGPFATGKVGGGATGCLVYQKRACSGV
jgi:hypothetical protein